jgi:RNA polymerase sigma-70 factor (ECF subfamily)
LLAPKPCTILPARRSDGREPAITGPLPDHQALDAWFHREILPLQSMLLRFLRRNWANPSEIEDLMQETYIRVCQTALRARPLQVKALLFLVARNLMIDRLRQLRLVPMERLAEFEWLELTDSNPNPEGQVNGRQELRLLQTALDHLPPRCRQVVILRKVEGCSQREVARQMGITEETVEHHLAKGMRILGHAVGRAPTGAPRRDRQRAGDAVRPSQAASRPRGTRPSQGFPHPALGANIHPLRPRFAGEGIFLGSEL